MSDLAAAERERDEALGNFEETYADLAQARYELKQARSDLADERKALAASQQDLTRVYLERDEHRAEATEAHQSLTFACQERDLARAELASTYKSWAASVREYEVERNNRLAAERERDDAVAELGSARQELQALRARESESIDAMRRFLDALGIDPEARPLMAARELAAEVAELRKQAGGGPG